MTQRGGWGEDNQHVQVIWESQPHKYIFGGQPPEVPQPNLKRRAKKKSPKKNNVYFSILVCDFQLFTFHFEKQLFLLEPCLSSPTGVLFR